MSRTFLIDGYNLLHQIPELADSGHDSLEDRRESLLRRLTALTAGRRLHLKIVFDGQRTRSSSRKIGNLQVLFAAGSADDYMRQVIARNELNPNLVIVTSDRKDIGSYARICGLEWVTCQDFWNWIREPVAKKVEDSGSERDGGAPPGWTPQDDAELLKQFQGKKRQS